MPSPILTFSFILATLYGAGFHLIVGGDIRRLALFIVSAWIGFGVGHLAGAAFSIQLFAIGALNLLPASIGAGVALVFMYALTASRPTPSTRRARKRAAR